MPPRRQKLVDENSVALRRAKGLLVEAPWDQDFKGGNDYHDCMGGVRITIITGVSRTTPGVTGVRCPPSPGHERCGL